MAIGMSYDDYWNKDAYLTQIYYKLHDIQNQQRNEEMWLQGAYFFNAMQTVMHNSFSKKGQKAKQYLSEPFDLTPKEEEPSEEKVQKERTKVIDFFDNLKTTWDKKNG